MIKSDQKPKYILDLCINLNKGGIYKTYNAMEVIRKWVLELRMIINIKDIFFINKQHNSQNTLILTHSS